MKKLLTLFALLGTVLTMNAQIFSYGFEGGDQLPGVVDTVNFYQDWKDAGGTLTFAGSDAYEGTSAFYLQTPAEMAEANRWERVLRFTAIPVEDMNSYRVTFFAKTSEAANIHVAMMSGELNADMPWMCSGSTQQVTALTGFSPDEYVRKSLVFYYPGYAKQAECFETFNTNVETLPTDIFLRFSLTSACDYLLDNITIEKSDIAGIYFNGDVIKIDFGYATNAANLAAQSEEGTLVLDKSAVSVTADGEAVGILSVEIKNDGFLYIYLDENSYLDDETGTVAVSFTNPNDAFVYSTAVAPESWTTPNAKVHDFTAEKGCYDPLMEAPVSVIYEEAVLKSSVPADGSFELSETVNEFSFVYNKQVYSVETENNDAPVAVLSSTNGLSEALVLKGGIAELTNTLTFVRTGTEPLVKGEYTIEVSGVTNYMDVAKENPDMITFEVGKVSVSTVTLTELFSVKYDSAGAGQIPSGWTVNNEGEVRPGDSIYSGGPRIFVYADGGNVTHALYLRSKYAAEGDAVPTEGSALYGDLEGHELTIPAGDIQLTTYAFGWKAAGVGCRVLITDLEGNTVADEIGYCSTNVNGSTAAPVDADKISVRFTSNGGRYLIKLFAVAVNTNWTELMVGGFTVYNYSATEGETSDSEVVFEEKFTTVSDNFTPADSSGWFIYDANVQLNQGADYNYAGSRIFQLSGASPLTGAYYSRMLGEAEQYYGIYGDEENGPKLTLAQGKHQFSYYAANWKTELQLLHFELLDADNAIVMSRVDSITANLNGGKGNSITPNKIQFNYVIPAAGDYKLKFWMTGECMVGNISIMKVGSMAVYYKNLLKEALVLAQEEYEKATADIYAGTTYTALGSAIVNYTEPDFHTGVEYTAAIENLEALVVAMSTRRTYISSYSTVIANIESLLAEVADTKYESLDAYPALQNKYNEYAAISGTTLEDAELIASTTDLTNYYNWMYNMVNTGVSLLTKQIVTAAAQIVALDDSQVEVDAILAAGNAITDDQVLMSELKLRLTAAIYKSCAGEGNPFSVYDEEYASYVADSIDVSCYIQNSQLYTTTLTRQLTDLTSVPGWTLEVISGTPEANWGWSPWTGSTFNPIFDGRIIAGWNTEVNVSQEVTTLPVGNYSLMCGTQDRGSDTDFGICSHFYYQIGENIDSVLFDVTNQGAYYDLTNLIVPNVALPVTDSIFSSIRLGSHLVSKQSTGSTDNFGLFMTAKDPTFDYAASLVEVEEILSSVKEVVMPEGEPLSVQYFNIAGARIMQPKGVTIKVSQYAGGFMKVEKVFIK